MGKENLSEYWAKKDTDDIGKELFSRVDEYFSDLETSGYFAVLRKSYRAYFGSSSTNYENGSMFDSTEIRRAGTQGELHQIKVNHYRNLLRHVLVLTTNPRPNLSAKASNSDFKSQAQTILADGIIEYYMREKRLERDLIQATEYALALAQGFIGLEWDATAGEPYGADPDTGKLINTGDVKISRFTPLDVVLDVHKDGWGDHDWLQVRRYQNKYDLMAKYPGLADEIDSLETKDSQMNRYTFSTKMRMYDSADIPVFTFFHKKSDALPEGRMTIYCSEDVILYDGPLPYRNIPIYRVTTGEFWGSPYGYTQGFDLLALQEGIDSLYSSLITNNLTFATQNIWMPRGANINITHLHGGLNLIESDGTLGMPQPMQLTASPAEAYRLLEILENKAEILAGVNSVVRGDPESSLKSGAALALVASQAIQFNSFLQGQYVALLEDVGTGLLQMLQDYATVPRLATIMGKFNRPYIKEFVGADIDQISRVTVEVGSPIARTAAGRANMAEQMLNAGLFQSPDEYLQVLNTGKLEPLIEGKTSELLLIKSENESLRDGKDVPAIATEDHRLHIQEHKSVLSNPESKLNVEVVNATLAHINQHVELLRNTDPALLVLLGQQPLQPQQAPAPAAAPTNAESGAMTDLAMAMEPGNNLAAEMPNMPKMPTNPMTGQPYEPITGGTAR